MNERLKTAIETYTGGSVQDLATVQDPYVANATAVRASVIVGQRILELQFLVTVPLVDATEDDLEEVEFTQWPPVVHGR